MQNNYQKFIELREKYPIFVYDDYQYEVTVEGDILLSFSFFVGDEIHYKPEIYIKYHPLFADFYVNENWKIPKIKPGISLFPIVTITELLRLLKILNLLFEDTSQ